MNAVLMILAPVFLLTFFGVKVWAHRLANKRVPEEIGHAFLEEARSDRTSGRVTLYDDFLVIIRHGFAQPCVIPYDRMVRVGASRATIMFREVDICIDYEDDNGSKHFAEAECGKADVLLETLRRRLEEHGKQLVISG